VAADQGASSTESAAFRVKPAAGEPEIALRWVMTLAWGSPSLVSVPYTLDGPLVPPPPRTRKTVPWAVFQDGFPPTAPAFVETTAGRRVSTEAPGVCPGLGDTTVPCLPASKPRTGKVRS
jgi:hypothetical protein